MPTPAGPYAEGLGKNAANYVSLSPISFLRKAAAIYPNRVSVIHGAQVFTWADTYARCRRLASALQRRGVGHLDTVAVLGPNVPAVYEAHFGVPMAGAVINALNIRLDAEAIAFQLRHGEAKVLIVDGEFGALATRALEQLEARPLVIDVSDRLFPGGATIGDMTYEDFLAEGDPGFAWALPVDEFEPISLNYTSGTTGNPKGVVAHHRGAYLNAIWQAMCCNMPVGAVLLWTLPMFHCNGWCCTWSMAALAGTNVCLRKVEAEAVFAAMRDHGVTHMCGAPIVYNTLINAPSALKHDTVRRITGLVAGAAPPAATIAGAERIGITLTHVYGLTETYGPAAMCYTQPDWAEMPADERARLTARQGFPSVFQEAMTVLDPLTLQPVPADGQTIGEIMFRGNTTMNGYLKNPKATAEAFAGGWFHSGDLAVIDPDGYVRIKDRSKDVIISGGENISSIEVEDVLHRHPAVGLAAVVARPDDTWGEVPCAFIDLKPDATTNAAELRAFCRLHLAGYKIPKLFVFSEIPKTGTGKVQKFLLRETAKTAQEVT
jgi:fatty-acyl-CoA synthase